MSNIQHPSRLLFLDCETTGRYVANGNRIIEIGVVEMIDRVVTQNSFHCYLDPEREVEPGATNVHGFTWEDLKEASNGQKFKDIMDDLNRFIGDSLVFAHNMSFDSEFLDDEYKRVGSPRLFSEKHTLGCTLELARAKHPNKRNSLDMLCNRYEVSNEKRTLHGALIDAQILAEVYCKMTQEQFDLVADGVLTDPARLKMSELKPKRLTNPKYASLAVIEPTAMEKTAHNKQYEAIKKIVKKSPSFPSI
ncbi:DNA polymerase III subunit epsilon [Vibrio splendidus]